MEYGIMLIFHSQISSPLLVINHRRNSSHLHFFSRFHPPYPQLFLLWSVTYRMFGLPLLDLSKSPSALRMPKSKEYSYSAVNREQESSWLGDTGLEPLENRVSPAMGSKMSWILYMIAMITSVLCGGTIGYNLQPNSTHDGNALVDTSSLNICETHLFEDLPTKLIILDDGINFELHTQRFNGSFFRRSSYSGPPTPEIDETWGRFTEAGSSMLVKINQGPLFCPQKSILTLCESRMDARLSPSTECVDRRCSKIHKLFLRHCCSS